MSCWRRIKWVLPLLLLGPACWAQARHWVSVAEQAHHLQGRKGVLNLEITVENGYHIQAHQPADPALIPTRLSFTWPDGFRGGEPAFPATHPFVLTGSQEVLQVFSDTFVVGIALELDARVAPGNYEIPAVLSYQACDASRCLFPRELGFLLRLKVL